MIKNNDIPLQLRIVTERFMRYFSALNYLHNLRSQVVVGDNLPEDRIGQALSILHNIKELCEQNTVIDFGDQKIELVKLIKAEISGLQPVREISTVGFRTCLYYLQVKPLSATNESTIYIPFNVSLLFNEAEPSKVTPFAVSYTPAVSTTSDISTFDESGIIQEQLNTNTFDITTFINNVLYKLKNEDYVFISTVNNITRYELRDPNKSVSYSYILKTNGYDDTFIDMVTSGKVTEMPIVKINNTNNEYNITDILVTDGLNVRSVSITEYKQKRELKALIFSNQDSYDINIITDEDQYIINGVYYIVDDTKYIYNEELKEYELSVSYTSGSTLFLESMSIDPDTVDILKSYRAFCENSDLVESDSVSESSAKIEDIKSPVKKEFEELEKGVKAFGKLTLRGGKKTVKGVGKAIDEFDYAIEANELLNTAWNLLIKACTITTLSLLTNPILGLVAAIIFAIIKMNATNRMTIEKVRRNLADSITNMEYRLKEAEDKKDYDTANKFRRVISKVSIRLQIIEKRIEKMDKKEQELKDKKEAEGAGR